MSQQETPPSEHSSSLTSETLIAIIILLVYTVASPIFEKKKFHYMHESGLCMIIGIIISGIALFIIPGSNFADTFNFNDQIFFGFILPPIIFSAGYNLRRATFFKYFMYISAFGIVGTVISFLVVTPLTYLANKNELFYFTYHPANITITNNNDIDVPLQNHELIHFTIAEILLFASVISATDTIAALTFVKEETSPKLFAILFGEGVLNDAVCIVLYRILRDFTSSGEDFTTKTPIIMLNSFFNLFFFSFIVGAIVGCFCAYLLKYFRDNNIILNRTQEISVLIFFAFFSYTVTEHMGLSPIISLLFSGMFMSNYAFYNLSFQAREESSIVARIMSNIAEAFVFTYLGLTLLYYVTHCLSLTFIFIELIIVVLARFIAIFGLCFLIKACGVKSFKLTFSQKGIMSFSGSIRGAIAFGLAISIDTSNTHNKEILVSSTLLLVFFTTVVFGAAMPFMIKFLSKFDKKENVDDNVNSKEVGLLYMNGEGNDKCNSFGFVHPNFIDKYEGSKEKNFEVLKNRISYWIGHYWFEFDEVYIKPRLCCNWPWNREDNMNLKNVIIKACKEYEENEQSKLKECFGKRKGRRFNSLVTTKCDFSYIEMKDMKNKKSFK